VIFFDLGLEKLKEHSKNSYMHSYFVFYSFGAIKFEGNFISYNRNEANVKICEGYLIVDHFHPQKGNVESKLSRMKGTFK